MRTNIRVSSSTKATLEGLPISNNSAVREAIRRAYSTPETLSFALTHRFRRPKEENVETIPLNLSGQDEAQFKELIDMSELSGEQVARLAVEAYLSNL